MAGNAIPDGKERLAVVEESVDRPAPDDLGPCNGNSLRINGVEPELAKAWIVNNGERLVPDAFPIPPLQHGISLKDQVTFARVAHGLMGKDTGQFWVEHRPHLPPFRSARVQQGDCGLCRLPSHFLLVPEVEPVDGVLPLIPHLDVPVPGRNREDIEP